MSIRIISAASGLLSHAETPLIRVQHHHAHIASCMAEHQLQGPVIGLAFDGTGLGEGNTIWGGEVLLADEVGYRRMAHLENVPMPGAAAAIKEPWRMGLAYLQHTYGRCGRRTGSAVFVCFGRQGEGHCLSNGCQGHQRAVNLEPGTPFRWRGRPGRSAPGLSLMKARPPSNWR